MKNQEEEIRRIPKRSFIFKKKSNFREVLYIEIHDSVRRKELLQRNLPEKWKINSPEAIISITGVDHQFNIRDKCNLKRDLIEAVINTGSWIVTCGTEFKVVQFIEDAVNEHIALQDCHIPIVGILSQSVHEEIIPKYTETVEVKGNETKWIQIATKSTKDALDPNHTQFIFTKDFKRKQTGSTATSECREAFEHFLSNISINDTGAMQNSNIDENNTKYDENEIQEILPVILVLIEGGMDALRTAVCVLESENPVVVINGSGGAADFLASCFERDISNDETVKPDENLSNLIKKCFEDDSMLLLEEVKKLPLHLFAKHELIYIYSLEDKAAKVDEYIQNAMFDMYKAFYAKKLKHLNSDSEKRKHSEIVIKKQLKLVTKWKRCDIAWNDIFIAENRNELSDLQTTVSTPVMNKLREKMDTYLKMQVRRKLLENDNYMYMTKKLENFDSLVENIDKCISQFEIAEPSVVRSFTTSVRGIKEWLEITLTENDEHKSMNNVRINFRFTEDLDEFETLAENMEKCISKFNDVKPSDVKSFSKSVKTIKECLEKKPTETDHQKVYEEEVNDLKDRINDFLSWQAPVNIQVVTKFKKRMEQFLKISIIRTFISTHPDAESHLLKKIGEWKSEEVKPSNVKSLTNTLHAFKKCLHIKGGHEEDVVTEFWQTIDSFLHFQVSGLTRKIIDLHKAMEHFRNKFRFTKNLAQFDELFENIGKCISQIVMTVLLPVLIIQKIGFITIANYNSSRIKPSQNNTATDGMTEKKKTTQETKAQKITSWIQKTRVYLFYDAPIVKFLFYLITYLAFVVIFSIFVLTDLHPLSEKTPSVFEYMTWLWTLSLAIEEIRQIAQPSKGSFQRNIVFWAKNVWNIFDMLMYLLFFVSVMARCLLISDEFYYARLAYAITLAMFIFRTMHFFFVARYLGPKVVMIGRLIGDLAFFFALFALFVFSFGIMYQAILFPNSLLSPWELFKDLIYLPYWQMYGELNLDRIEGEEPSKCTSNPVLYANGTMPRCAQKSQFNSLILAIYLVLTNIVLVNLLIAMFSRTFEKVEDNAETIWKFNRYALVYEYYDRPMFPIPIVIHLTRIIVLCCYNLWTLPDDSPFESTFDDVERRKLHIVESRALLKIKGKQDASNTETDGKDKSANNQPDIDEVYEEIL